MLQFSSIIDRFRRGFPPWLLAVTIFLPFIGLFSGLLTNPSPEPTNTRFFLSALAGAQAGVLAIVFSVTVIGIQLVSTRYSPRMVSLFIESPTLIFTFWLFIASIGFDLWLMYTVPANPDSLHTAGVYAAAGAGLAAVISLFVFIKTAIRQSTPEGAINAFVAYLSTDKYLLQVIESVENDLANAHPLHPLYSMVMAALSNRERATAELALQKCGELARDALDEFVSQETFSGQKRQVSEALFGPVLKEHLHDIALHAEEQDESQIVGEATEWQAEIGRTGLNLPEPQVARQAVRGLSQVIIHCPVESGSYTAHDRAWSELGELMTDAADEPHPRVVRTAASTIKTRVPRKIWQAHEGRRLEHSMTQLYREMRKTQEHLLDHYGEDVAAVEMNWQHEDVPTEIPHRERVDVLYQWREALLGTTGTFLDYRKEEGEFPIAEGNLPSEWANICEEASTSTAEDYAVALCQAMIEAAFIDINERGEDSLSWVTALGQVKHEGEAVIVDRAFDRILSFEYTDVEPPLVTLDNMDEIRRNYYQTQIRLRASYPPEPGGYSPLNTHTRYPELVEELGDEVEERREYLENRSRQTN